MRMHACRKLVACILCAQAFMNVWMNVHIANFENITCTYLVQIYDFMKYISIILYDPSMIPSSLVITSCNIVWTKWSRGTASSGPKWIATMFNWNTLKVWFSMNGKKWTRNLDDLGGFGGIWGYILFWKHLVLCDSFEPGHVWDKNMSYFLHGLEIFHPWWPGGKLVGKWWRSWGLRAKKSRHVCWKVIHGVTG